MKRTFADRMELAVLLGTAVTILMTLFFTFAQDCQTAQEQVLRLHILANSDSQVDQQLKLQVRDWVLEQSKELFYSADSRVQVEEQVQSQLKEIAAMAQAEVQRQGYDYPVTAQLTNMAFNTREYDSFTMPAGQYDALRLVIGEGKGHNWWCVMFPPLCVPAASREEDLNWFQEQGLQALEQKPQYEPRFAAVELLQTWRERLTK